MDSLEIWAEKYRPRKLDDVIDQRHVVERVKVFVKERNIPHMLYAGPPGSGKTTVALCISEELFGSAWRQSTLETNASDERGINVIRQKIKDFARTRAIGDVPFKIIVLDEADALTPEAQQALRRTMETFTRTARFILCCNYSSRVIEPIQSRCAVFRFRPLSGEDVKAYVMRIVQGEGLKVTDKAIEAIIYFAQGDLRKAANLLQASAALSREIDESSVYEAASQARPEDVRHMLEKALSGHFQEAREILQDMLLRQGLMGEDVIREIHRQVYSLDLTDEEKVQLIDKIGEYDFRLTEGGNELIQLEALLAQFLRFSKAPRKR
ncbi:MAG: replication factor C small subunit [Candidatus Bathyarchaeia archaeon]